MTIFAINVIGLLFLILAAFLMAYSESYHKPVTFFICTIGLIGLLFCLWATLGRLFFFYCETYKQMCAEREAFEGVFGQVQVLRHDVKAATIFITSGIAVILSMFFVIYVGVPRQLNVKLLFTLGCLFLLLGGSMQMYAQFVS